MDGDPEKQQVTPKFVQTLVFLLFFTACNSKKEDNISPLIVPEKQPEKITAGNRITQIGNGEKTIYLTFDDGPNKGTQNVLNIVNEEKVPATFFVIGQQVNGSAWQRNTYQHLLNSQIIEIENHSYTHAHNKFNKFYTSPLGVVNDFVKCTDSLHLYNKIARTPGRNIWRTANISSTDIKPSANAADSVWKAGYTLIGWDVEWHFNNHLQLTESKEYIHAKIDSFFSKTQTKTANHLVLLAHDQSFADATDSSSLHQLIKQLKNEGVYKISTIIHYPTLHKN